MIAYVFFHELTEGGDTARYEDGLGRFHAALAAAGVPGLVSSVTHRVGGQYCDWYVVESSAALDGLNDAAVSGGRSGPHADVASQATKFAGKLLKLVAGDYDPDARVEVRFSKPRGMSYPDLYGLTAAWTDIPGVSLWRRMMVLGPPPEFCLLATSQVTAPAELEPEVFRREPL